MTECRDCLDFADSLHDALPFLDPAVFKDIQKLQKLKVNYIYVKREVK